MVYSYSAFPAAASVRFFCSVNLYLCLSISMKTSEDRELSSSWGNKETVYEFSLIALSLHLPRLLCSASTLLLASLLPLFVPFPDRYQAARDIVGFAA